jgi:hypothetical protein
MPIWSRSLPIQKSKQRNQPDEELSARLRLAPAAALLKYRKISIHPIARSCILPHSGQASTI